VQIALVGLLALLIAAAVAAYAWDRAQANDIAGGIRIGGVPIGGLSEQQARKKLRQELVKPLKQPITATFEGKKYILAPKHLDIHADLDGMLDEAHQASREGNLPTRLWRYATGDDVNANLPARVGYAKKGVDEFVDIVSKAINRPATEASVQPTASSINLVPGADGVAVDQAKLREAVINQIGTADARRVIPVPVSRTKSNVTTEDLAAKYPTYLTVDRTTFQLRLWKNLKLAKTYPIAVGMQGLETPAGTYTINDKQVNPSWHVPDSAWAGDLAGKVIPPGPADPIKARWMGFFDGAGIHGTDEVSSLGSAASHGCVRMSIPDVEELYDQVPLGTPIYIGDS
jgi:L,D-transpeptidase-like protein/putative peptidoglycan binding protein